MRTASRRERNRFYYCAPRNYVLWFGENERSCRSCAAKRLCPILYLAGSNLQGAFLGLIPILI